MTVTSADASAEVAVRALRTRVRDRLEVAYLRPRTVDRPALMEMLADGSPATDPAVVGQELAIVDERIAAIHRYLATVHDPHPAYGSYLDCCVLLDTGDGPPTWLLLAALPFQDEQVIDADSPLGRAIAYARAGQVIRYVTHTGPRIARVLAMEPSGGE